VSCGSGGAGTFRSKISVEGPMGDEGNHYFNIIIIISKLYSLIME
jgi:hypothetical protein